MVLPGPERTSSPEVACTGHHAPSCPTGPCREPSTATARSPARKSGRRPGAWWCGVSSVMIELDIPGVDELSGVLAFCASGRTTHRRCGCIQATWAGSGGSGPRRRLWRSGRGAGGGHVLAIGLLDGPDVLRLTVAPEAQRDEGLARQVVSDVAEPERGVLPPGKVSVETPNRTFV